LTKQLQGGEISQREDVNNSSYQEAGISKNKMTYFQPSMGMGQKTRGLTVIRGGRRGSYGFLPHTSSVLLSKRIESLTSFERLPAGKGGKSKRFFRARGSRSGKENKYSKPSGKSLDALSTDFKKITDHTLRGRETSIERKKKGVSGRRDILVGRKLPSHKTSGGRPRKARKKLEPKFRPIL